MKSCHDVLLESLVARRAACLRAQPRQPPEAALPASHTRFYTAGSVRRRREMRGASMRSWNVRSFKIDRRSFHQSVNHVLATWLGQPRALSLGLACNLSIMFLSRGKTSLGPTNVFGKTSSYGKTRFSAFLPNFATNLGTCTSCDGFDWLLERLGSSTAIYAPPSGRCRSALPSTTP